MLIVNQGVRRAGVQGKTFNFAAYQKFFIIILKDIITKTIDKTDWENYS